MKNYLIIVFLTIILFGATGAFAQDFHCARAWKKDWKADKKEAKIQRKMFHDHWRKAEKKRYKSEKKSYKSEKDEWEHKHYGDHDVVW